MRFSLDPMASPSRALALPISFALWLAGLVTASFQLLDPPWGPAMVAVGLILMILLAPVEYGLGALAFSFVGASAAGLHEEFGSLRWVCLGAAAVVFTARFLLRRRSGSHALPNFFEYLLLLFLVIAASTLMTSAAPRVTLAKLIALLSLFLVASRVAAHLADTSGPTAPRRLLLGLLIYPLGLMAFSLFGYLFSVGPNSAPRGRFTGLLGGANAWAALVLIILPWMVAMALRERRQQAKPWIWGFASLLVAYTLLLSLSRGALLGVLAAVTLLFLVHGNRKVAVLVLLAATLFSARLLSRPEALQEMTQRYLFKHEETSDVLQSRAGLWAAGEASFRSRPWMGLGFGVTTESESQWTPDVRSTGMETGSSFWGTLIQVGALGAAPLFLAILLVLPRALRFAWRVKDPFFTGLAGSCLALSISAVFEGWLIAPGSYPAIYFWIQCFFLNAMMCRFRPAPERSRSFEFPEPAAA